MGTILLIFPLIGPDRRITWILSFVFLHYSDMFVIEYLKYICCIDKSTNQYILFSLMIEKKEFTSELHADLIRRQQHVFVKHESCGTGQFY